MLPRFRKQGHLLIGQRKCGNWTDTRRLLEKLEGFLERMGKIERSLNGYPIWFNLFYLFYTYLQCGVPDLSRARVSSVRRAGPQPRLWWAGPRPRQCAFGAACRTATAMVWVQCGVPDLNRDGVSSVWRAGPQPRSCEFSVTCRAATATLWVQCGVPGLNRDRVSSVWRAGPQPRSCEFSVARRTSTGIVWVQLPCRTLAAIMGASVACRTNRDRVSSLSIGDWSSSIGLKKILIWLWNQYFKIDFIKETNQ